MSTEPEHINKKLKADEPSENTSNNYLETLPKVLFEEINQYVTARESAAVVSPLSTFLYQTVSSSTVIWAKHLKKDFFGFDYLKLKDEYGDKMLPAKDIYQALFHFFDKKRDEQFSKVLKHSVIIGGQFFPPLYLSELPAGDYSEYLLGYWLSESAKLGNLALVRYLMQGLPQNQRVASDQKTLHYAALSGNLPLVQYLLQDLTEDAWVQPDQRTLKEAALSGSLPLVRYLIEGIAEPFRQIPNQQTLHTAISSGSLEVVRYLIEEIPESIQVQLDGLSVDNAIRIGSLKLLQYFLLKSPELHSFIFRTDTFESAVSSGNIDLVRYLIESFPAERKSTLIQAIKGGLSEAAKIGGYELFFYLMGLKAIVPVEPSFLDLVDAISSGNIDLVRYLLSEYWEKEKLSIPDFLFQEEGEEFDQNEQSMQAKLLRAFFEDIINPGSVELFKYLIDYCSVKSLDITNRLKMILHRGDFQFAQYLIETFGSFSKPVLNEEDIYAAAASGNFWLFQYILGYAQINNIPLTTYTARAAIESGNFELLKFVLEKISISEPENRSSTILFDCGSNKGDLYLCRFLADKSIEQDNDIKTAMLLCAAGSGNSSLAHYLVEEASGFQIKVTHNALRSSAYSGNLNLFNYLFSKLESKDLAPDLFLSAIDGGNLNMLRYLIDTIAGSKNFDECCQNIFNDDFLFKLLNSGNLSMICYIFEELRTPVLKEWLKSFDLESLKSIGNSKLMSYVQMMQINFCAVGEIVPRF